MNNLIRVAVFGMVMSTAAAWGDHHEEAGECMRPQAPTIPGGALATPEEMNDTGVKVRAFVAETQDYLACLEAKEASYGDDITEQQQAIVNAIYNASVDVMQAVAAEYNTELRAFRERSDP